MTKISELLKENAGKRTLISCEFFPPKNEEGESRLYSSIAELQSLHPDFVSITYGAGGSTQQKTLEWALRIQNHYGITVMSHFTCVGAGREEIGRSLHKMYNEGIRNIMALRGDPPKNTEKFRPPVDGFAHASDLISYIKATGLDFSIGGAAYPEVHPEAASPEEDLKHLKTKTDSGADFLVTQLFFDNNLYFQFLEKCRNHGIDVPVIPGIMPVTHYSQIERFTAMTGCYIPENLKADIENSRDNPEKMLEISIRFTVNQVTELIRRGVPGIHFYTLNQSRAVMEILRILKQNKVL